MLKRVSFVAIDVADQDRALEFYTQKLGFKISTDQMAGPMRWIELRLAGAETRVALHKADDFAPHPSRPAATFIADDVEATYEELVAKGVEFTKPPTKAPWGEHAIFKDSEGNLILFAKG